MRLYWDREVSERSEAKRSEAKRSEAKRSEAKRASFEEDENGSHYETKLNLT